MPLGAGALMPQLLVQLQVAAAAVVELLLLVLHLDGAHHGRSNALDERGGGIAAGLSCRGCCGNARARAVLIEP